MHASALAGSLPPTALELVPRWAIAHQDELMDNWKSMAANGSKKYKKLDP